MTFEITLEKKLGIEGDKIEKINRVKYHLATERCYSIVIFNGGGEQFSHELIQNVTKRMELSGKHYS